MKLIFKILFFLSLSSGMAFADDGVTRKVHQQFIDDYIVRHLNAFKAEAQQLETSINRYCFGAAAPRLPAVKLQFSKTVRAWMPLQSMRFGAFEKNSRDLRIYFWPNSRGEKQAGKFLTKMDSSKLVPDYFPKISVALQGLPIIEWLLYHPDSGLRSDDQRQRAYSCRYMHTIGKNIINITFELLTEFEPDGAMRTALLTPSDSNPAYGSLPEVSLQLYKNIHAMVELVHGQKLSRPVSQEFKFLKPKRLEMWRSGQSKQNLHANIAHIFEAYLIFSPLVVLGDADTDIKVKHEFELTLSLIDELPDDFYAAFTGDQRQATWQQGRQLIAQLLVLRSILADNVTAALDIPLGFNSLDGD